MKPLRMYPTKHEIAKENRAGTWLVWMGAPRQALNGAQTIHVFQVVEKNGKHAPGPVVWESVNMAGRNPDLDTAQQIVAYLNSVHADERIARMYIEVRNHATQAEIAEMVGKLFPVKKP